MRVLPAVVLAFALVTGIAGCSGADDPDSIDDLPSPAGDVVEDVPTIGEEGTVPATE